MSGDGGDTFVTVGYYGRARVKNSDGQQNPKHVHWLYHVVRICLVLASTVQRIECNVDGLMKI